DSAGTNAPDATSSARRRSASSMAAWSSSVRRPARWSTSACACEARTSYGASTQSNCVDLLSAAIASAGPEAKRPPHSAPSLVPCVAMRLQAQVALGRHLARQPVDLDEALGVGLVERVALVVGGQVEVVKRLTAAAAVDGDGTTVQHQTDVAAHALLRFVHERVQSGLQRREPQAVVHQLSPPLLGLALEPSQLPLERDVLELLVRPDEH